MYSHKEHTVLAVFGAIALIAVTVIIMPFVSFWLAYFGGWLASLVIGNPLCTALNTLFNTNHFEPSMLPWIAGAFGWIGGYFKTTIRTERD